LSIQRDSGAKLGSSIKASRQRIPLLLLLSLGYVFLLFNNNYCSDATKPLLIRVPR